MRHKDRGIHYSEQILAAQLRLNSDTIQRVIDALADKEGCANKYCRTGICHIRGYL
jgi:hypothetical protein